MKTKLMKKGGGAARNIGNPKKSLRRMIESRSFWRNSSKPRSMSLFKVQCQIYRSDKMKVFEQVEVDNYFILGIHIHEYKYHIGLQSFSGDMSKSNTKVTGQKVDIHV